MSETTYATFNERKIYIDKSFSPKFGQDPVDLWENVPDAKDIFGKIAHNESRGLWGKVDHRGNTIQINEISKSQNLKMLSSEKPIYVLDFVASAFKFLQDSFTRAESFGRISRKSIIKMIPKKGFINAGSVYNSYIQNATNIIVDSYLARGTSPIRREQIRNFDDFLKIMHQYIDRYAHTLPLTKTAIIKSPYCTAAVSGMIIELSTEDYNTLSPKMKWINDPNFNFYRNTARKVGFLIDKNAPWRLVANLRSPNLQRNFFPHGLLKLEYYEEVTKPTSPDPLEPGKAGKVVQKARILPYDRGERKVMSHYFVNTYLNDVEEIKEVMKKIYNTFVNIYPTEKVMTTKRCSGRDVLVEEEFDRKPVSSETLDLYGPLYWLKFYFHLRANEENITFSEQQIKTIHSRIFKYNKYVDFSTALGYINYVAKRIKEDIPWKGKTIPQPIPTPVIPPKPDPCPPGGYGKEPVEGADFVGLPPGDQGFAGGGGFGGGFTGGGVGGSGAGEGMNY